MYMLVRLHVQHVGKQGKGKLSDEKAITAFGRKSLVVPYRAMALDQLQACKVAFRLAGPPPVDIIPLSYLPMRFGVTENDGPLTA